MNMIVRLGILVIYTVTETGQREMYDLFAQPDRKFYIYLFIYLFIYLLTFCSHKYETFQMYSNVVQLLNYCNNTNNNYYYTWTL